MDVIRKKLQKFSNVICVFAKIGYVASIVGVCLCGCALLWTILLGSPSASVELGEVTIAGFMKENGMNLAEACGTLAYALTYCAFLIAVMRLIMRLFANMRDQYTPFTTENASLFKRVAIWMIVASIVPATVGQAVGHGCAKLMSLPFSAEYGDGFSMVIVLLFFAMSMVFQYGCALQEQADTTL